MRSPSDQRLSHKLDIWKRPWSLISLKIRHFALIRACFGLNSTGSEFRLNPIECNRCFAPRKRFIVFCFPVMTSFLLITFWGQLRAWSLPLGPRFVLDDGSYLIDVSVLSRDLKKIQFPSSLVFNDAIKMFLWTNRRTWNKNKDVYIHVIN